MVSVDSVYKLVGYILDKKKAGAINPAAFNEIASFVSTDIWEDVMREYSVTQKANDDTTNFLKPASISINSSGLGSIPSDYGRAESFYKVISVSGTNYRRAGDLVSEAEFSERQSSAVAPPTTKYPIGTIRGSNLYFMPLDLANVTFMYFRKPEDPVWDFDIINNVPVFVANGGSITNNPSSGSRTSTSTDFDFRFQMKPKIVMEMCKYFGLILREGEIASLSQQFSMEASK